MRTKLIYGRALQSVGLLETGFPSPTAPVDFSPAKKPTAKAPGRYSSYPHPTPLPGASEACALPPPRQFTPAAAMESNAQSTHLAAPLGAVSRGP